MTQPTPNSMNPFDIDITVPHAARVYDYLLGGVTHFAVDRAAAEQQAAAFGGLDKARSSVRGNREFLVRVVRHLVEEAGIRQFLDIGTGIPTEPNVHQVAQEVDPSCRAVYVDNDPIVSAHAHELLRSTTNGATAYLQADLREPDSVLKQAAETLDFGLPVAVLLIAVLHLMPDEDEPHALVRHLIEEVPLGSALAISHMASDIQAEEMAALARAVPESARYQFAMRSQAEIDQFFDGLVLVEPGVVPIDQWRPQESKPPAAQRRAAHHWGALGRKP
jgi:hypothetical protein